MIARALFLIVLLLAAPARAQDTLEVRTAALRAALADTDGTDARRSTLLQRQLLTSLERRQNLERSYTDAKRLVNAPIARQPNPEGLLERDGIRRQLQELDTSLLGEARRAALLKDERDATAARLADVVAAHRTLAGTANASAAELETARLEMQLAESVVAELDLLSGLLTLQRDSARRRRTGLAAQIELASSRDDASTHARDEAAIEKRLHAKNQTLQSRLAAAMVERERAKAELDSAAPSSDARSELLAERLANADIELDLTREALANLALEQAAWELALRFQRDGDAAALIEAREQGPRLQQRLQRRGEFLSASSAQVLERIGALDAGLDKLPAQDLADRKALREVFELRLRRMQLAVLDEKNAEALLERLRGEFEAHIDSVGLREKAALGAASVHAWIQRLWNFELFAIDQSVEVEGRKTSIANGVTVGKLIKAPLLLLFGLFLSFRLTAWVQRRARRRGVDEDRARLVRRWSLGVLVCAWTLASLALAGIPLAAFAFAGGAIAIGLGFGTQNLFKNFISGILVLVERPFRLGDVIEVGTLRGTVVDIDLRTSVVRDRDGAETLIPNSTLVDQSVRNLTFRSRSVRQSLSVQVEHDCDPRLVMDAVRSAAERHGQLLDAPAPVVHLSDLNLHGHCFSLHYWLELKPDMETQRIASDLRLMVFNALADAGLRLARTQADAPLPAAPTRGRGMEITADESR